MGVVSFALGDGLFEEELDLTVHGAEILLSPGFELGPEFGVDSQQEWFSGFTGHGFGSDSKRARRSF